MVIERFWDNDFHCNAWAGCFVSGTSLHRVSVLSNLGTNNEILVVKMDFVVFVS